MAYPHFQITVPILASNGDAVLSANATGRKGKWDAGLQQYFVRRVSIQHTTTGTWTTGAVFSFILHCGGVLAVTGNQFARLTQVASLGLRRDGMVFNDSFTAKKIPAGYGITVAVAKGATGKLFRAFALVEPSVERLQNLGGTGAFVSVTG